jgi:hypothetical protein
MIWCPKWSRLTHLTSGTSVGPQIPSSSRVVLRRPDLDGVNSYRPSEKGLPSSVRSLNALRKPSKYVFLLVVFLLG